MTTPDQPPTHEHTPDYTRGVCHCHDEQEVYCRDCGADLTKAHETRPAEGITTARLQLLLEAIRSKDGADWLAAHDAEVKAEALADLPLDGLRQAVRVLRGIEHHWPADSVAEVVALIERAAAIRGEQ